MEAEPENLENLARDMLQRCAVVTADADCADPDGSVGVTYDDDHIQCGDGIVMTITPQSDADRALLALLHVEARYQLPEGPWFDIDAGGSRVSMAHFIWMGWEDQPDHYVSIQEDETSWEEYCASSMADECERFCDDDQCACAAPSGLWLTCRCVLAARCPCMDQYGYGVIRNPVSHLTDEEVLRLYQDVRELEEYRRTLPDDQAEQITPLGAIAYLEY